jgi:hypothetical protein
MKTWCVWCPERGEDEEDGVDLAGGSAEAAAIAWAEKTDAYGDYDILKGSTPTVHVRGSAPEDAVQRFVVYGETVPHYRSRSVQVPA